MSIPSEYSSFSSSPGEDLTSPEMTHLMTPGPRRHNANTLILELPPWHHTLEPRNCPAWLAHLNRIYEAKIIPAAEMDRFRQAYARELHYCRIAVELYERRRDPSSEDGFSPPPDPRRVEPSNTTVFVGGLVGRVPPYLLEAVFLPYGPIEYVSSTCFCREEQADEQVKCPEGKGCGFVKFVAKTDADYAIERMQGFALDKSVFRTSWATSGGEYYRFGHTSYTDIQPEPTVHRRAQALAPTPSGALLIISTRRLHNDS